MIRQSFATLSEIGIAGAVMRGVGVYSATLARNEVRPAHAEID